MHESEDFFVGRAEHCFLLQGQMYLQEKKTCFSIWARLDTKFFNLAHLWMKDCAVAKLQPEEWPVMIFFCVRQDFANQPQ